MFLSEFDREVYDLLLRSHHPRTASDLACVYTATQGSKVSTSQVLRGLSNLAVLGLAENTKKGWAAVADRKKILLAIERLWGEALQLTRRRYPKESILKNLAQSGRPLSEEEIHSSLPEFGRKQSAQALERLLQTGLVIAVNKEFTLHPSLRRWMDEQFSEILFLSKLYARAVKP